MNESLEEAVGRVRRELEQEMDTLHKQLQVGNLINSLYTISPKIKVLSVFLCVLGNR